MATLTFKTNITSPLGIQALWDSLRSIGVNSFKINFTDFNNALTVVSDYLIPLNTLFQSYVGWGTIVRNCSNYAIGM